MCVVCVCVYVCMCLCFCVYVNESQLKIKKLLSNESHLKYCPPNVHRLTDLNHEVTKRKKENSTILQSLKDIGKGG